MVDSPSGKDRVRRLFAAAEEIDPEPDPTSGVQVSTSGDGPAVPVQVDPTQQGVAEAFASQHADELRFDHSRRCWYCWDGDRWAADRTQLGFDLARKAAALAATGVSSAKRARMLSAEFASGVERIARANQTLALAGDEWDRKVWDLPCPGGLTIDLRTGECRASHPENLATKIAGAEPDNAVCTRWHAFLDEVTQGDEEIANFLQLWAGYALTGSSREHALLFVFGSGGNGKSVLLNVLSKILGDYTTTAPMESFTASRGDRHPTDLAGLRGARLVTATETEEGRSWAEARITQLTGGDPIAARFMRGDFFTFVPHFKLMFSGNHEPLLRSVDPAIRRRFIILPFLNTPLAPDPDLEDKLLEEAPAILGWAIRGAIAWYEDGLPRPASIVAATNEYFASQDTFGAWWDERVLEVASEDGDTVATVFASFQAFAERLGEKPGTAKSFGQKMRKRGRLSVTRRVSGSPAKVYPGVMVRQ